MCVLPHAKKDAQGGGLTLSVNSHYLEHLSGQALKLVTEAYNRKDL